MTIETTRLDELLGRFPCGRIMVVGDLMLDEYVRGVVDRVSPEAPIPVVNIINNAERDIRLGGAANVFNNLIALGAQDVVLCGVVGDDPDGEFVRTYLHERNLAAKGLIVDPNRPTTIKTRIIAHNQQVVRLDREERGPIAPEIRAKLADFITNRLDSLDAIIFSDYEKGVITPELLEVVLPQAARQGVIVAVDPKFTNFRHFKNVSIVVPNRKEASGFVRYEILSSQDALAAAQDILSGLNCENVLIKLGEAGMRLVSADGTDISINTAAEQVYDVTGAGDTVISTLVLARAAGASWQEAARIANVAAGVVIHYIGTTVITRELLRRAIVEKKDQRIVSRPREPQPVKLIASILGADMQAADQLIERLQQKFGDTDYISDALQFNFTDYYEPEMGTGLQRRLLSFAMLIMPDELPAIKLATNALEDEFTGPDGKRTLNIDPGYITLCHLILATGKAFTHRPYLRDGIYADMTLVYRAGRFQTLEWTFPDYGSEELLKILTMLRERYFKQLKQLAQ